MRAIATEQGMTLGELSKIAETDMSIDKKLDDRNIEIGQMENIVLDSRLGFHFIPNSFKVYLDLDPKTSAERILNDKKNNPNRDKEDKGNFDNIESIIQSIAKRNVSEKKRYKDLYHIDDPTSHSNFDLVINTKKIPLEEVSRIVVEEYNKWLNK
jgi:cytidylate kinase